MAMSVGAADDGEDRVVSEINTTPLVDVMLVLLIIFLITIPVVTTSVKVSLPKQTNQFQEPKPENVIISVDKAGNVYYYDSKLPNVPGQQTAALVEKFKVIAKKDPQPEVHIRGDLAGNYEPIGRVLYALQRSGIVKVSFLTEPPARQ
jgi:biopolymer transport protein ExbD